MPHGNPHGSRTSDPPTLRPSCQKLPAAQKRAARAAGLRRRRPQTALRTARVPRWTRPRNDTANHPERDGTHSPTATYPAAPGRIAPSGAASDAPQIERAAPSRTRHKASRRRQHEARVAYPPASPARASAPGRQPGAPISAWAASYFVGDNAVEYGRSFDRLLDVADGAAGRYSRRSA